MATKKSTQVAPVGATETLPAAPAGRLYRTESGWRPALVAPQQARPSHIVLSVRARTEALSNYIEHAQAAGFEWHNMDIALLDSDTQEVIASLVVDHSQAAFGTLRTIDICMDTERCAVEWCAGRRLVQAGVEFARLVGADLCDAAGAPISTDALAALAARIDAAMEQRREAALPQKVRQPDGSFKRMFRLSFCAVISTPRGRDTHIEYFDAQPMPWFEGRKRGYQMAREMLDFRRSHRTAHLPVVDILAAAGAVLESKDPGAVSVGNVAQGFLDAVSDMLEVGARDGRYGAMIDRRIGEMESQKQSFAEYDARVKAERVERMRAGRVAKRAARVGSAA